MKEITASDVRLGNTVTYFGAVVHLNEDDMRHILDGNTEYKALVLTEHLLIELGFVKIKPRPGIAASYLKDGIRVDRSNSNNFYFKKRIIKLHDLQNIYHANKGHELSFTKELKK